MQLGCFGFHRQIYPQEGDSKKKWKIEIFGKFDMPTCRLVLVPLEEIRHQIFKKNIFWPLFCPLRKFWILLYIGMSDDFLKMQVAKYNFHR